MTRKAHKLELHHNLIWSGLLCNRVSGLLFPVLVLSIVCIIVSLLKLNYNKWYVLTLFKPTSLNEEKGNKYWFYFIFIYIYIGLDITTVDLDLLFNHKCCKCFTLLVNWLDQDVKLPVDSQDSGYFIMKISVLITNF